MTKIKVIFQDIDGVLKKHGGMNNFIDRDREFDSEAVANLNRLVALTGAKLVLSTAWRWQEPFDVLCSLFKHEGIEAEIIGTTLMIVDEKLNNVPRGYEIEEWLSRHPEVESYLILDDWNSQMLPQQKRNYVRCIEHIGFTTDAQFDRALNILMTPLPPRNRSKRQDVFILWKGRNSHLKFMEPSLFLSPTIKEGELEYDFS